MTSQTKVIVEGSVPILRVASLEASLAHYVSRLGFTLDWEDKGIMGSVSRDRASIMLCEGDQGHAGGWLWIGVSDAERLHEELTAKGVRIRMPPTNFPWALEMQVEDLDGNVLRFGSDPKEGVPFGPWTDMYGTVWERAPEGGWRRANTEGAL